MLIQSSSLSMSASRFYSEMRITEQRAGPSTQGRTPVPAATPAVENGRGAVDHRGGPPGQPLPVIPPPMIRSAGQREEGGGPPGADGEMATVGKAEGREVNEAATPEDLRSLVVKMMVEQISGQRIELFDPSELTSRNGGLPPERGAAGTEAGAAVMISEIEQESVEFSASGQVRTADGREIHFSIELSMSRQRITQLGWQEGGGKLTDPLVVDFSGRGAELLSEKGWFDLNQDGQQEEIALLAPGSAYLSLDQNRNGTIDHGGELFGPESGDGFNELRRYDQDGNNWIDEADPVYDRLSLWSPSRSGGLQSLRDAGIGAIHLGTVSTRFELVAESTTVGQLRESGFYLGENGRVGAIQQIDLVV